MTHCGLSKASAKRGATVNINCGLWYPVLVVPVTLVVSAPLIRNRKDVDIHG